MSQNSTIARVTEVLFRNTMRRLMHPKVPLSVQRRVSDITRWMPTPKDVTIEPFEFQGVKGELHTPKSVVDAEKVLLYFHGGGYTLCSPATHRTMIAHIAREAGVITYAAQYRLAPEHRYPAQIEDAVAAFDMVLAQGYTHDQIVIGGDSAGGNLTLALTQALRDRGDRMPKGLVLISPAADLSFNNVPQPNSDALLPIEWVKHIRWGHMDDSVWLNDPKASPILANFTGFPPVLMQSSSVELLANDAKALAELFKRDGVLCDWQEAQGLWHDYQLQAGTVPEATEAVQRIGQFIHNL